MPEKSGKVRWDAASAGPAVAVAVVLSCVIGLVGLVNPAAGGALEGPVGTLPQIIAFQISPAEIVQGGSAVLTWKAENASVVNIDQGVGDVAPAGQVTVNPAYSTTYKMTVSNNAGVRTRYLALQVNEAKVGEPGIVGVDPVTGRNSSVDLSWEDYCYSSDYQVQIARDAAFTLKVYDSGVLQPADAVFPAFSYPPGRLEAGHTYYWRVRTVRAVTGQRAISPWSEARPITVQPGFPVRADTYGVQALSPVNNGTGAEDSSGAGLNANAHPQNVPALPAETPLWAIVIIVFGSLLIGMVVVVAVREGKKI